MTEGPTKKVNQRKLQAEQRKQELLESAKKLFAQEGYHATSTRSINKAIGMADGLIYHYFPGGKLEILETLIEEEYFRKVSGLQVSLKQINPDQPISEILTEVGQIIFSIATKDKELVMIFLREQRLIKPESLERYRSESQKVFSEVASMLAQKLKEQNLKELDPFMMILQFISGISFYLMQTVFGIDGVGMSEEEYLNQLVAHTMKTWS